MVTRVNPHDMGVHEYRGLDDDISLLSHTQADIDRMRKMLNSVGDIVLSVGDITEEATIPNPDGMIATDDIPNGSSFYAMDTGTLYFFDAANQDWITSDSSIDPVSGDDSGGEAR